MSIVEQMLENIVYVETMTRWFSSRLFNFENVDFGGGGENTLEIGMIRSLFLNKNSNCIFNLYWLDRLRRSFI